MAEGDGYVYNGFLYRIARGEINLATATLKIALLAAHTVDVDNDAIFTDVSGDEESGGGYSAGGSTLAGQTVTQNNTANSAVLDGNDLTFTSLNVGTPSHAVMYVDNALTASDYLCAGWELGRASNGGDYQLVWNAAGIITLNAA